VSVLDAVCDTFVPSLPGDAFMTRSASDLGVPALVADAFGARLEPLLARLGESFASLPLDERTRVLRDGAGDPHLVRELRTTTVAFFYALPDNPNWLELGYPGPISSPPSEREAPKTIPVERVSGATATISADVCVVGSGAGGAVIAARLQAAGRSVVVLERGSYRNEADFQQLELQGTQELYLRGGLIWSEGGSVGLIAGSTLGGGTVVNSLVCLRPLAYVREEWGKLGLDDTPTTEFDRCIDAVWKRLDVNTDATVRNRTSQLMAEALSARDMSWEPTPRNARRDDDARFCGYCNWGCQQGCKNSTLKTYLQDAADSGTRVVVDARVERVLTEGGRASGVLARVGETELVVEAPTVVVACGGIESPVLLLRSGIGGPAVGKNLCVHPTYFVGGVYADAVDGWDGQIQSVLSFDRARAVGGDGFLIEPVTISPGFWSVVTPWRGGREHKERMRGIRNTAPFHALCHDHNSGEVVLGEDGEAVVRWRALEIDREIAAAAQIELARLHREVGALEIFSMHEHDISWRDGEDFDAFVAALEADPHERIAYSAHQMSSCRLGRDPETSVADPNGELHDVEGVWIGDGSALPTSPGVNPMISIMALAERTAGRLLNA
jgi:choline dehydrogenase-like flavoprotein